MESYSSKDIETRLGEEGEEGEESLLLRCCSRAMIGFFINILIRTMDTLLKIGNTLKKSSE